MRYELVNVVNGHRMKSDHTLAEIEAVDPEIAAVLDNPTVASVRVETLDGHSSTYTRLD